MSSTPFEVYVFDFDGTLVQSAAVKRQAFFEVFPVGCATAVAKVLERDPDGSRHEVIPAMIADLDKILAECLKHLKKRLDAKVPVNQDLDPLIDRIVAEQAQLGA